MAKLEQLLRGIKMVQAKKGKGKTTRLPITPTIMRVLKGAWLTGSNINHTNTRDAAMLWAVCFLCFFGFFRSGELTAPSESQYDPSENLSFRDIAFDSREHPSTLRIHLKASKTDPFHLGMDVFVGKTSNDLCPIAAMVCYLSLRSGRDGPLFVYEDGKFLTRESLVACIREALNMSGVDAANYSGHSFRSSAATTALQAGISDAAIQMLGRWRSDAYKRYIKTPADQLAAFSERLAHQ